MTSIATTLHGIPGANTRARGLFRNPAQTARHSHSATCPITSPNSSKAADQTKAEVKLANWKSQYGISKIPAASGTEARNGPEKPPDENAGHAPVLHEGFAARQHVRIARQRPHLRDVFLVLKPNQ